MVLSCNVFDRKTIKRQSFELCSHIWAFNSTTVSTFVLSAQTPQILLKPQPTTSSDVNMNGPTRWAGQQILRLLWFIAYMMVADVPVGFSLLTFVISSIIIIRGFRSGPAGQWCARGITQYLLYTCWEFVNSSGEPVDNWLPSL